MWNEYFHEQKDIEIDNQHTFRVYLSRSPTEESGPLIVLLHGGGFSALTWSLFVVSRYRYVVFICPVYPVGQPFVGIFLTD